MGHYHLGVNIMGNTFRLVIMHTDRDGRGNEEWVVGKFQRATQKNSEAIYWGESLLFLTAQARGTEEPCAYIRLANAANPHPSSRGASQQNQRAGWLTRWLVWVE